MSKTNYKSNPRNFNLILIHNIEQHRYKPSYQRQKEISKQNETLVTNMIKIHSRTNQHDVQQETKLTYFNQFEQQQLAYKRATRIVERRSQSKDKAISRLGANNSKLDLNSSIRSQKSVKSFQPQNQAQTPTTKKFSTLQPQQSNLKIRNKSALSTSSTTQRLKGQNSILIVDQSASRSNQKQQKSQSFLADQKSFNTTLNRTINQNDRSKSSIRSSNSKQSNLSLKRPIRPVLKPLNLKSNKLSNTMRSKSTQNKQFKIRSKTPLNVTEQRKQQILKSLNDTKYMLEQHQIEENLKFNQFAMTNAFTYLKNNHKLDRKQILKKNKQEIFMECDKIEQSMKSIKLA
ncbi:UNKNOWN [Stylonychia lemnae]|uniref:Uncharacterized protein n=1 Tax=Stylonychia lemnae TaxID=5949 RepID=A0A077ZPQ6_STYLE|nr:UNKNOWN [Stylonychia lemnae]|eukprot:CDW71947.1 UNKNOWN [Stylonychia lemnae]